MKLIPASMVIMRGLHEGVFSGGTASLEGMGQFVKQPKVNAHALWFLRYL